MWLDWFTIQSLEHSENCKVASDRPMNKEALHIAPKSEFNNSKLYSAKKDSDELIMHVEELRIKISELCEEYDVTLDGLDNHLTSTGPGPLTTEVIQDKLNYWYKLTIKKKIKL